MVGHEQIDSILKQAQVTYDWPGLGHSVAGSSMFGASVFGASELGSSAFGSLASRAVAPSSMESVAQAEHAV